MKDNSSKEYTALYREWRPATFDEVVGQDSVVRILKNQITYGRISHAYLFCGPRGTGKTSTAKIFAKAINCTESKDGNPCGHCDVCKIIDSENNIDIIEIDAASHTGVENIREIRDKVKYPPSAGSFRVYIIDEVHMLSTSAFNAFLKTLEEPPEHIVFILATTEPHRLPSTVLSRCQRYDFKRITLKVIMARLRAIADSMNVTVEEQALEAISRWSEGGMRDSISLLDQCISFCGTAIKESDVLAILGTASNEFLFELADNIIEGDIPSLLIQIDKMIEDGGDIAAFLKDIVSHLRNLLITNVCDDPSILLDVSQSTLEQYQKQSSKIQRTRLIRALELLSELEADIKWNTKPRIMLEMAMIKICRPQDGESFEDLRDRVSILERQLSQGVSIKAEPQNQPVVNKPQNQPIVDDPRNQPVVNKPQNQPIIDDPRISLGEPLKPMDMKSDAGEEIGVKKKTSPHHAHKLVDIDKAKIGDKDNREADKKEEGNNNRGNKVEDNKSDSLTKTDPEKIEYPKIWGDILKIIRKDRIALYPLLRETTLRHDGKKKNIINLIFPSHQGFYAAAMEKETNSKYVEALIAEKTGQNFRLKCYTQDNAPVSYESDIPKTPSIQEEAEESPDFDIVQKAINIFGEENVEVVDD